MSDVNIVHLNLNYSPTYNKRKIKVMMENKIIKKLSRHMKNKTQNEFLSNNDSMKKNINKSKSVNKSVNESKSIESSNKNSYEHSINNILENQKKNLMENESKNNNEKKCINLKCFRKKKQLFLKPNQIQIKKLRKSLSLNEYGKLFRKNNKKFLENKQHVNKLLLPKLDKVNSFDLISKNLNAHEDNYNVDNFNNDMRNFDEQYETMKIANENSKVIIKLTKDLGRKSFLKQCKKYKDNIDNNEDFRYIMKFPNNSIRNLINSNYKNMRNNRNFNKIRYNSFNKVISGNKSYEQLFHRDKNNYNYELSNSNYEGMNLNLKKLELQKLRKFNFNSLLEQILNNSKEIRKITQKISSELSIENMKLTNDQL